MRLPPELDEGAKAESLRLSSNNADLEDKCLGWPVKGPDFELRVDKACNLISRITNWIFPVKTELATEKPLWQP